MRFADGLAERRFAAYRARNADLPEASEILAFAERFAELCEERMALECPACEGSPTRIVCDECFGSGVVDGLLSGVAEASLRDANTTSLADWAVAEAVRILIRCWANGAELGRWWRYPPRGIASAYPTLTAADYERARGER